MLTGAAFEGAATYLALTCYDSATRLQKEEVRRCVDKDDHEVEFALDILKVQWLPESDLYASTMCGRHG